jgi:PAS domain S-box-containing protein
MLPFVREQGAHLLLLMDLSNLSDRSPGLIAVHHLDGTIRYMNPAAVQALEYSIDEVVGRNMMDLLSATVRPFFPLAMERLRTQGNGAGMMVVVTRTGRERSWWYRHTLCEDACGAAYVVADSIDLSELRLTDSGLHESEERFRYLAEHIHQVFWVRDPHTNHILYLSPAYEEVWGRPREEILQQPYLFLHTVHPEDRDHVLDTFGRILAGESTSMEYRIVRPDGGERWISSHSFPVRDQAGQLARVVAITEDISERKRAEVELRRAKEVAEAATLAKSRLLAHVSHEVRTPLQIVMGMCEILQGTDLDAEQRHLLDRIDVAARQLHSLANDLLDFSRFESGRIQLQEVDLDLDEVLRDAVEPFEATLSHKRVGLRIEKGEDVPSRLRGDPQRLRQVVANLVGNAVKFSERGEIVVKVGLANPAQDDGAIRLCFAVRDSGPGIAEEDLARIFEPFSQAHAGTKRNFGGVGLGLAICRQLVEALGGKLAVDSRLGEGSTFTFTARFGR